MQNSPDCVLRKASSYGRREIELLQILLHTITDRAVFTTSKANSSSTHFVVYELLPSVPGSVKIYTDHGYKSRCKIREIMFWEKSRSCARCEIELLQILLQWFTGISDVYYLQSKFNAYTSLFMILNWQFLGQLKFIWITDTSHNTKFVRLCFEKSQDIVLDVKSNCFRFSCSDLRAVAMFSTYKSNLMHTRRCLWFLTGSSWVS